MAIRLALFAVAFAGLALLAPSAHAWGDLGHKVVCEFAFRELNDKAREKVKALIAKDPQFSTFADSCTFPDHPRKREPEHFVNLKRTSTAVDPRIPCETASECVITGIMSDVQRVAHGASEAEQLEALKFLGHWLGDIHQPLHVSFEDDRGGNSLVATGPCPANNLHSVWDTCLITNGIGTDAGQIVDTLRAETTDAKRAERNTGEIATETVAVWATESFDVARRKSVQYCVQKTGSCWYAKNNRSFDPGETKRRVNVNNAYIAIHAPVVKLRLKKAGVRLGRILNETIGQ